MKNILSKSYITLFFLLASFVTFAQPGTDDGKGTLEGTDAPAPVGDYLWVLALAGLVLVFLTFRAIQNKKVIS